MEAIMTAPPPPKPVQHPPAEESAALASLLSDFLAVPELKSASAIPVGNDAAQVTLTCAQRAFGSNTQKRFAQTLWLDEATLELGTLNASPPQELPSSVIFSAAAPSGTRVLVARSAEGKGGEPSGAVLELWRGARMELELQIPASLHGPILNDGWFGSGAAWSSDETRVAYVAEVPPPTETPEWGLLPGSSSRASEAGPLGWRGVGPATEDWGERYSGRRAPSVFLLDARTGAVARVPGLPSDCSMGQPVWAPDGRGLVCTAWPHRSSTFAGLDSRLGMAACPCRAGALWWAPVPEKLARGAGAEDETKEARSDAHAAKSETSAPELVVSQRLKPYSSEHAPPAVRLTPENGSAFSPRFSPDGETLVFLSTPTGASSGVHAATNALSVLRWPCEAGSAPRVVVDVLQGDEASERADESSSQPRYPRGFPGLYCTQLPPSPFLDARTLVLSSCWRSSSVVLAVELDSGVVRRLSPLQPTAAWAVVAACGGWVLASASSLAQPWELYAQRHLPAAPPGTGMQWSKLPLHDEARLPPRLAEILPRLCSACLTLETEGLPHEALVLRLESPGDAELAAARKAEAFGKDEACQSSLSSLLPIRDPPPALIFPHGGPHSVTTAGWTPGVAFLASLGFGVVLPNFRGSTGFGERALQSLPGRAGCADVADCLLALQEARREGLVSASCPAAAVGGSHGGFLTLHLLGQHPDDFCAGVARNPVCDLSLMVHLSDIPDWCFVEALGAQGVLRAAVKPASAELERMAAASPVAHVRRVRAPVLMLLGGKDRRVPSRDAVQYLAALRTRGQLDEGEASPPSPPTELVVFAEDGHSLDGVQTEFEQWLRTALWCLKYAPR